MYFNNYYRSFPNFKDCCDDSLEYSTFARVNCTLHHLENSVVKT